MKIMLITIIGIMYPNSIGGWHQLTVKRVIQSMQGEQIICRSYREWVKIATEQYPHIISRNEDMQNRCMGLGI